MVTGTFPNGLIKIIFSLKELPDTSTKKIFFGVLVEMLINSTGTWRATNGSKQPCVSISDTSGLSGVLEKPLSCLVQPCFRMTLGTLIHNVFCKLSRVTTFNFGLQFAFLHLPQVSPRSEAA